MIKIAILLIIVGFSLGVGLDDLVQIHDWFGWVWLALSLVSAAEALVIMWLTTRQRTRGEMVLHLIIGATIGWLLIFLVALAADAQSQSNPARDDEG